jgi:aspartokinase-like uncharacterized kinase
MTRPIVMKVGGSLFDLPDLPRRLTAVLDSHRTRCTHLVVLVGGGPAADFIRALDRRFALGDRAAHDLALHSLDLTAHALAALLPGLVVVDELSALDRAWSRAETPVLAPRRVLDAIGPPHLPASWSVTSDAIAARLAVHLGAAELVLLKSTPLPPGIDRRAAAALGLVDPLFPDVSRYLPRVVYVNLRADRPEAHVLGA